MSSPDWFQDQFEQDLANFSEDRDMSDADYELVAQGVIEHYVDRVSDQVDVMRNQLKEQSQ